MTVPAAAPVSTSITRGQYLVLIAAVLGWMFDGMEMGIFPLVARPALREMGFAGGMAENVLEGFVQRWMGLVTAFFLFGAAAGGLVFGWLGDRIGRVRAMSLSILAYSVFTGLCYFATAPWHLAFFRFISALGMGGEWSLGVALVMESWPASRRPLLAGVIGAAANAGYLLIALLGIFFPITDRSWRWVMLVGAAPALLTFFIRLFVPESERWKSAVLNRTTHPIREILSPPLLRQTLLGIAFASVALIVTWGIVQWIPLWADRMAGGLAPRAKAWGQFWQSIGACGGCLVAALAGGRFGRRVTYFFLCLTSFAVCQWLFNWFHAVGAWFFVATFVVGFCTASFYGWMPLYLPELFPTRARATGQGLSYNFGRILAGIGVLQMASLMALFKDPATGELTATSYARAGAAVSLVYLVGAALIWLAPETRNRPLPD